VTGTELKAILEALIFASPDPLTPKTIYALLASEPREDVEAALDELRRDYDRPGGLQLVELAGGFQIVTRPEMHEWVRRLFGERTTQKLSVQALETLAVVAYRQPITAAEITEVRGVNTSGVLNTLLERHLIKIVGRKQVVGRPFMYASTKEFLIRFGLKDLSDLPKVEDMAEALGLENTLLVEQSLADDVLPLIEPAAEPSADSESGAPDGVPEGADAADSAAAVVPAADHGAAPIGTLTSASSPDAAAAEDGTGADAGGAADATPHAADAVAHVRIDDEREGDEASGAEAAPLPDAEFESDAPASDAVTEWQEEPMPSESEEIPVEASPAPNHPAPDHDEAEWPPFESEPSETPASEEPELDGTPQEHLDDRSASDDRHEEGSGRGSAAADRDQSDAADAASTPDDRDSPSHDADRTAADAPGGEKGADGEGNDPGATSRSIH
jgi:segregation and condensation protein B